MASQHGPRFSSQTFKQNFSPNNFNLNSGMDKSTKPHFQRPANPSCGSFQSPERFIHRFENRPQLSNFSDGCTLNRPPSLPSPSVAPTPPILPCNPFNGTGNSPSHSPYPSQPSNQSRTSFNPQVPVLPNFTHSSVLSQPPPSLSKLPFSSQCSFSPQQHPPQNNLPSMSRPPSFDAHPSMWSHLPPHDVHPSMPPPLRHDVHPSMPHPSQRDAHPSMPYPPQRDVHPSMSRPPLHDLHPSMSHPPTHGEHINMPHPPRHDLHSNMSQLPRHDLQSNISQPPQYDLYPNMPQSPQHGQHPNMSQLIPQNKFSSMSQLPHQHRGFHLTSAPSVSGSQLDNSLQHPYRMDQTTRFSGERKPFTKRFYNSIRFRESSGISKKNFTKKNNQQSWDTRKLKDNETEKPYSCDTCDRAFVTETELNDHISQHVKCDYENCTFEAHIKIVLIHKKMQHETGYAERISKLSQDDAEIKKWREERRKRFPTVENVRKRKAEQAEKEARGEVLETKEFGKFRRTEENKDLTNGHRKRMRGHRAKRNNFHRSFNHPVFQHFKVNPESDSDSDSHISLNMFPGLLTLENSAEEITRSDGTPKKNSSEQNLPKTISNINENNVNASHSENNSINRKNQSPVLLNCERSRDLNPDDPSFPVNPDNQSLTISEGDIKPADESVLEVSRDEIDKSKELIVIEDSDDEGPEVIAISKGQKDIYVEENSDNEGPEVIAISKCQEDVYVEEKEERTISNVSAAGKNSEMNHHNTKRNEGKDMCEVDNTSNIFEKKHGDSRDTSQLKSHRTKRENGFSIEQHSANQIRKSSLLEKLLADDIRHERNVILQCIRHIVNNNFFGLVKRS